MQPPHSHKTKLKYIGFKHATPRACCDVDLTNSVSLKLTLTFLMCPQQTVYKCLLLHSGSDGCVHREASLFLILPAVTKTKVTVSWSWDVFTTCTFLCLNCFNSQTTGTSFAFSHTQTDTLSRDSQIDVHVAGLFEEQSVSVVS